MDDAVTACSCNELGSEQPEGCDAQTGQCKCKERYIGQACDSCQVRIVHIPSAYYMNEQLLLSLLFCIERKP